MYGEFVLTQENIEIPRAGKIYSFNEGNYQMWDESLRKYIDELNLTLVQVGNLTRQGTLEVWSEILTGLCCIVGFTGSAKSKKGMLRLLYECVPKSFMLNKVGEETKKVIGIPDRYINGFRFTMEAKKK
ncbi:hypothetical protein Bca4012_000574 [Brassica carinata]